MARLFIIGNGFDSAHGYDTDYSCFRNWIITQLEGMGIVGNKLREVPEIPVSTLGNHEEKFDLEESLRFLMWLLQYGSDIDEEWNEFEDSLYSLDLQAVYDESTFFVYDGSSNDDSYYHSSKEREKEEINAEQEYIMFAQALRDAMYTIKDLFALWINSLVIGGDMIPFGSNIICNNGSGVSSDDLFISFNYTETLELVYGVPEQQVFHLHGYRKLGDELIVGHGDDKLRNFNTERLIVASELEEAIRILRKDTDSVIRKNRELWEKLELAEITDVYSFGYSFSKVDLPYIQKISHLIKPDRRLIWHLNSRDHGEKNEHFKQIIRECGYRGSFDEYN